ncbi:MAG: O-antigen ligase family protein [Clostridia bacterium]|nr:O-antigen ligase family protein [Clostridia bacterium]MBR5043947.1 O-antigen ligase family protein [Clostridia bacterium]
MFPGETPVSGIRSRGYRSNGILGAFTVTALLFLLALLFVWFKWYVVGAVVFALIASAELFFCSDLSIPAIPLLFLSCIVLPCYDSFNTFVRYAWVVPIFLVALIFNLIVFREKMKIGRTFFGQVAVMVALMLGGTGFISRSDLLSPMSLFYVLSLGLGMVLIYLLVKSRFSRFNIYGIFGRIAPTMYLVGLLCCAIVLLYTLRDNPADPTFRDHVFYNLVYEEYRPSNNLSTLLMLAMPFPVWYALKQHPIHVSFCFVFFFAIVTTGSRAGVVLGAFELMICYFVWLRYCGTISKKIGSFLGPLLLLLGLIGTNWFFTTYAEFGLIHSGEFRAEAIRISIEQFREHPIFGVGLRNHALDEIYQPKKGALCWFHMYFPQIFASMGLVGFAGYLLQIILRSTLIFRRKKGPIRSTLGLSYIGLFLMSQLNPGEFCPFPYALMGVAIFVMLEQLDETERLVRLLAPEWGDNA